jgi:hypothetical protein
MPEEPVFPVAGHDPANISMRSLEILDDRGLPIHRTMRSGNVHVRMVVQAGQVLLHAEGLPANVRQLVELTAPRLRRTVRALITGPDGRVAPAVVGRWNGHPIDVSPVAPVLYEEGFRFDKKRQMVYPPTAATTVEPAGEVQTSYPPFYSEEPPVEYNEAWVLCRTDSFIRPKLE